MHHSVCRYKNTPKYLYVHINVWNVQLAFTDSVGGTYEEYKCALNNLVLNAGSWEEILS